MVCMGSLPKEPVILLVHGAWHSPSCWDLLIPHLRARGYETETVSLPSVSATNIQDDFSADVSVTASAISTLSDQGHDVALLLHSYAGIVGSSAAKGLTKADRQAEGKQGGLSDLIFLASFMINENISLVEASGGGDPDWQPPDWWQSTDYSKRAIMPGGPEDRFYNDISDSHLLESLVKGLRPQAVGSFYSKATYAAWRDVPTTFIACTKDNAIPFKDQKEMMGRVAAVLKEGGSGRQLREVILESAHSPMISMPEKLSVEVIKALEA